MYSLLNGVKVLDLTTIVLGPYGTKIIADFGAEITKIEPLGGDQFRSVRPGKSEDLGAGFINLNNNKKSLSIDLTTDAGKTIIAKLVEQSDVVVHNMRPKSAAKFNLTFEKLKALKKDIIFCYAPGFGQEGRYGDNPAYDDIIQAASGLAYLNANAQGEPRFLPTIIGDKVGGLHLALSILAALFHKSTTGEGSCLEIPMFESIVSFMMIEQLAGKSFIPPLGEMGYARLQSPNRRPFKTKDGYISILPYSTRHWTKFLKEIGRDDIAETPWVRDPVSRSQRIDELYQVLSKECLKRTTAEWFDILDRLDVPHANVNRPDALLSDPHLKDVSFFREYDHPTDGKMRLARTPFTVAGATETPDAPAPHIGQNSREVLQSIGYDISEIEKLEADNVITQY